MIPAPIRTLIVDDEAPARLRLRQLLQDTPDFTIAGEAGNGRQAVEFIRTSRPDLVLLDVQMPNLDGFGVCAEIGAEAMPAVVFVTAYDRFALQAFDVHAADYLLKPVDRERFQKTLRLIRERIGSAATDTGHQQLLGLLAELRGERRGTERLAIKVDGKVIFLRTEEIEWIEAEGNYVRLHRQGSSHVFRDTLSALENHLPPEQFLRISRSVLVNLDAIRELQPLFYGDYSVILRDGTKLSLSRTYRDRVERWVDRRPS
ncbi:MAG: response regulator transcription factor [Verrucomicrobiales bacterium]|nr:response regulator transcription factor [Verrucomicrobiales bacterium]